MGFLEVTPSEPWEDESVVVKFESIPTEFLLNGEEIPVVDTEIVLDNLNLGENTINADGTIFTIIKENRDTFTMNRRMQYDDSHELSDGAKLDSGVGITGTGEAIIELKTDGKYKIESIVVGTKEQSEPVTVQKDFRFHSFLDEVIK